MHDPVLRTPCGLHEADMGHGYGDIVDDSASFLRGGRYVDDLDPRTGDRYFFIQQALTQWPGLEVLCVVPLRARSFHLVR